MRKLILKNGLSPGDIVMLSAAVRDLHRCYPKEFITDVRTRCPALWENNPYITPLSELDPEVTVLDCDYPLINRSNEVPCHCLHGFIEFLNEKLRLDIFPTAFKGDIHLSELEKSWFSQVHELTGEDTPFWIVVAGGKHDVTIKWWQTERYQQVVDHFKGKIQFVQVGEKGHYHPRVENVIDLRGKTDLRQFVRLVYHSQGVLCGVTAAMHLAAAVETKEGNPPQRPCVVIAGGREPVNWEAYPQHQFVHTVGQLRCCARGGCWKSRTLSLGDGDERDQADRLCVDVVNNLPRCMDMITPAEVIRRIENYFHGGVIQNLTAAQSLAAQKAVDLTQNNSFESVSVPVPDLNQRKAPQRAILIQQASGSYTAMLDLSHEVHAAYADRHHFTFWSVRGDVQSKRHPSWNKVVLIQMALMAGFDYIVWLDADTLIVKPERDIRDALPATASIGMCRHPLPLGTTPWHYNAGVIYLRNTRLSRTFFDNVWNGGPVDHPWHEQVVINKLSQTEADAVHPLEKIWNSTDGVNQTAEAVIRAWHGKGQNAIALMKKALAGHDLEPEQRNGTDRKIIRRKQDLSSVPARA